MHLAGKVSRRGPPLPLDAACLWVPSLSSHGATLADPLGTKLQAASKASKTPLPCTRPSQRGGCFVSRSTSTHDASLTDGTGNQSGWMVSH